MFERYYWPCEVYKYVISLKLIITWFSYLKKNVYTLNDNILFTCK